MTQHSQQLLEHSRIHDKMQTYSRFHSHIYRKHWKQTWKVYKSAANHADSLTPAIYYFAYLFHKTRAEVKHAHSGSNIRNNLTE